MDFNLLVRIGIAYGVSIILVGSLFIGLAFSIGNVVYNIFNVDMTLSYIFFLCLAVVIFDPVKRRILLLVNNIIFKSPDLKIVVDKIETDLHSSGSIELKAKRFIENLTDVWKVDHAGLVIWNTSLAKFDFFPGEAFQNKPIHKLSAQLGRDDFLIRTLDNNSVFKKSSFSFQGSD
jgi:hypothetical protein